MMLRQMWMQGSTRYIPANNVTSDEDGNFRIPNLQPGSYYVCARKSEPGGIAIAALRGKSDIRPVRTFYPGSMTRDGATAISIKPGQTVPGIDIRMQYLATYHIRGKIASDVVAGSSDMMLIQVSSEDDDFSAGGAMPSRMTADRSFDVGGVAPGRYWVSARLLSGKIRDVAEASVEVGASDVNDLVLSATPTGTLRGQISLDGMPSGAAADLKRVQLTLMPVESRHAFATASSFPKENGTFSIDDVSPAKYKVNVGGLPAGTYVQSVRFGSQDILGKEVDLNSGVSGELQVAIRYGVAEVSGILMPVQGVGDDKVETNDAFVILIPAAGLGDQTYRASPDQNGAFLIKRVPPGKHYAIAMAGLSSMLLQNADFLKALTSKGVELELKEKEKKQIQISLTPAADVQRILADLGIEGE